MCHGGHQAFFYSEEDYDLFLRSGSGEWNWFLCGDEQDYAGGWQCKCLGEACKCSGQSFFGCESREV